MCGGMEQPIYGAGISDEITITDDLWRGAEAATISISYEPPDWDTWVSVQGKDAIRFPYDSDIVEVYNASGDTVEMSSGEFCDMLYWLAKNHIEQTRLRPWVEESEGVSDLVFRSDWWPCGIACPECGEELEMYYENPTFPVLITADQFRCPSCGWEGLKPRNWLYWGD